jgi:hypothetical protein
MKYAAKERAELSHQRLTLRWGSMLKQWAAARRLAWRLDSPRTPLELLRRIDLFRSTDALWDVLERQGPELRRLDRAMCHVADCRWFRHRPLGEQFMEHSVQELARRAALEVPGVKPARIRYLLAREEKAGRLQRTARGRYQQSPRDWRWLEPEERYAHQEEDERFFARYQRAREHQANVLLVHYLVVLPAYRKAKALSISDRTYYYRLARGLELFQSSFEIQGRLGD